MYTIDYETFAFTFKKNVADSDIANLLPSSYDNLFNLFKTHGCIFSKVVFEDDNKKRCHAHGIVSIPKNLYRRKLKLTSFHICLKHLTDTEQWLDYIEKQQQEYPSDEEPIIMPKRNIMRDNI